MGDVAWGVLFVGEEVDVAVFEGDAFQSCSGTHSSGAGGAEVAV